MVFNEALGKQCVVVRERREAERTAEPLVDRCRLGVRYLVSAESVRTGGRSQTTTDNRRKIWLTMAFFSVFCWVYKE
ncbi:hypothetical protein Y032_0113g376 [Ancylostoma ceylanicum]|uniref:Uncharacterized protein n=1 Tax=Ancylostoma ceylanicum TaxID=53326 RepID=A0A016TDL1_9BILA|nr:hypothetical protein Y032_0113g376 [Ancylostoma ceylanicum]